MKIPCGYFLHLQRAYVKAIHSPVRVELAIKYSFIIEATTFTFVS